MTAVETMTVDNLDVGDQFKFVERGSTRTVTRNQAHSNEPGLRFLGVASKSGRHEDEMVTVLGTMPIVPVKIIRRVHVPCVTWRHGEDLVPILADLADGPVPRAVICGKCEGEINVELANETLSRPA